MLEQFIKAEDIMLKKSCSDWQNAIDCGAEPLLKRKVIEGSYVQAIKDNHKKMPYMVIAPGIMLAHARPECGAHAIGITLMTLANPVEFGSELNDPVNFVITLATPDDKSHVKLLEALTNFLMNPDLLEKFLRAGKVEDAIQVLKEEEN